MKLIRRFGACDYCRSSWTNIYVLATCVIRCCERHTYRAMREVADELNREDSGGQRHATR